MALPVFQTSDRVLLMMQNKWSSELNPVLSNPALQVNMLEGVSIRTGVNVINHLLGRKMQGWYISDINAAITLFRSAPMNDLTLTLTASGPAVINMVVF